MTVAQSTTVNPAICACSRWRSSIQVAGRPNAGSVVAVPISGGDRLNPGTGKALFPVPSEWRAGALLTSGPLGSLVCGVTPDGSKFLFQSTENDELATINVVLGWPGWSDEK